MTYNLIKNCCQRLAKESNITGVAALITTFEKLDYLLIYYVSILTFNSYFGNFWFNFEIMIN